MKDIEWKDGYITIPMPRNPRKITGTRFAALLGFNKWKSAFKTWCEITRLYDEPYEDTKYTIAGKVIEPKQHEYMRNAYFMDLQTPTDKYGADYFDKTHGDFYPDNKVFGGMWDALEVKDGKVQSVLEFKTTSRPEDWVDDVPDYYALQAALYAYLLDVEDVYMVCSFLMESEYDDPNAYQPNIENTVIRHFRVHEKYPHFDLMVERAKMMYDQMDTSPYYDEDRDKDVLKALRTESITPDTDAEEVLAEMAELKAKLDAYAEEIKPLEKAYKLAQDKIKALALKQFKADTNSVVMASKWLTVSLDKSIRTDIDKKALEADGLLDKYQLNKEIYTLRVKEGQE